MGTTAFGLLLAICVVGPVPAPAAGPPDGRTDAAAVRVLMGMGASGHAPLVAMLTADDPKLQRVVLETLLEHGQDMTPFVPAAAKLVPASRCPDVVKLCRRLLVGVCEPGREGALLAKIEAAKWTKNDWAALGKAAPALASRLHCHRALRAQAPKQPHLGFDRDGLRRTTIFGGGGGGPFADQCAPGGCLVGLRCTTINWAGHRIIRSIQPLYRVSGRVQAGAAHGLPNGRIAEVLAKPGYAVGGLLVRTGHRLDGYAAVFMRVDGDRLDPSDLYLSAWQGGHGGGGPRLIGGAGLLIAGICGRKGSDVDAIGLIERAPSPASTGPTPVRLTFEGRIDGSERIVIDARRARWENLFWGASDSTVQLNGVAWTPCRNAVLTNEGKTQYLSVPVNFASARLEQTKGRDTVAILPGPHSVTVRIADSPPGSDVYAFSILLDPVGPAAELYIRAMIDGSDELLITADRATWTHRHYDWPKGKVLIDDVLWDPKKDRTLPNSGETRFLPKGVALRSARVVDFTGRDLAAIETADDRLLVRFVDTPGGAAEYAVRIRFGPDAD